MQAVTALAFSDDGAVLLSGGEDTVASAWLLSDVLDASPEQGTAMQAPQTFQSWSVPLTANISLILIANICSTHCPASAAVGDALLHCNTQRGLNLCTCWREEHADIWMCLSMLRP